MTDNSNNDPLINEFVFEKIRRAIEDMTFTNIAFDPETGKQFEVSIEETLANQWLITRVCRKLLEETFNTNKINITSLLDYYVGKETDELNFFTYYDKDHQIWLEFGDISNKEEEDKETFSNEEWGRMSDYLEDEDRN